MYHRIGVGVPNVIFRLSFWEALTFSVAGVFFCAGIFGSLLTRLTDILGLGFHFSLRTRCCNLNCFGLHSRGRFSPVHCYLLVFCRCMFRQYYGD